MKKVLSVLLAVVMAFSLSLSGSALASTPATEEALNVVTFHEGMTISEIIDKKVLSIKYSDLSSISSTAKEIVDSGTMIYISDPEISAEAVADLLSIPKDTTTSYQNLVLMSYSIYKLDEKYVFANHYAAFADEGELSAGSNDDSIPSMSEIIAPSNISEARSASNFSNAILMPTYLKERLDDTPEINSMDAISTAISAKADMEAMSRSITSNSEEEVPSNVPPNNVSLPTSTATETWNDTLNVYGKKNKYYGYLNCTVQAYAKGNAVVNGSSKRIYDVISIVKAYPDDGYVVRRYETQIHCNIDGFHNLQTTTLPSGVSYSEGVSLSGSYGSNGGSGSVTYTTGWSYNPESQVITESSSIPRVVKWRAAPSRPKSGKAYDISPGMRVASPKTCMRGAFADVFCNAMFFGITINANSLAIGGWF